MNILRKIDREQGEIDRLKNTVKKPLSKFKEIEYDSDYQGFQISNEATFSHGIMLTVKEGRALLKYFTEVFDEG